MELGIHYANLTLPGGAERAAPTLLDTARAAEEIGCTNFTLMDHFFQLDGLGGALEPMLEGYTALGFLAGQTERMTLGLLVTGVTYRHPGLLAKTMTTLDVLSGGRGMLGIGAAWYERDHLGLAEPICRPAPLSSPRPKILIGGGGERKTLRFVARYADACNLFSAGHDEVAHKLEVLAGHYETKGRDPAEIERTIIAMSNPLDDVDACLADMEGYARVGIQKVMLVPGSDDPAGLVRGIGESVLPRLRDL